MNLPNKLTILRLVLTAIMVTAGSAQTVLPLAWTIVLFLFCFASLTDWLDGHIARRHKLITDFGKLMDPLADKVLVLAALLLLVAEGVFSAWAAALILSREFLVTGLRLVAASKGLVLPAENLGKYKTVIQAIAIISGLLWMAAREFDDKVLSSLTMLNVVQVLYYIATVLTTVSGLLYFWKNRALLGTT